MSKKVEGWIERSVTPTAVEVGRIGEGPDPALMELCAEATRPATWETRRFLLRRRDHEKRRTLRRLWSMGARGALLGGALTAAVCTGTVLVPTPYGPVDLPVGQESWVGSSQVAHLGTAIEMVGVGRVRVNAAGREGADVDLLEGTLLVDVDPDGVYRDLTVRAGEVEVKVAGTRFEVARHPQAVYLQVDRGEVVVSHAGEQVGVPAGQSRRYWLDEVKPSRLVSRPDPEPVARKEAPEPVIVQAPVAVVERPPEARVPEPEAAAEESPEPVYASDAVAYTVILDRMDQQAPPAELVRELEAFARAYPRSSHRHEAEFWRFYYLAESAAPEQTVRQIEAYMAENESTPRSVDIQFVHATLARDRLKDCQRALPSYRKVASHGAGEQQAIALAYQGLCAAAVGRDAEARWALEEALEHARLADSLKLQVSEALETLVELP